MNFVLVIILFGIAGYAVGKLSNFFTKGVQSNYYYETKTDSDGNTYESVIDANETSTEQKEK